MEAVHHRMQRGGDNVCEHKGTRVIKLQALQRPNLIQNTLEPDNEVLATISQRKLPYFVSELMFASCYETCQGQRRH